MEKTGHDNFAMATHDECELKSGDCTRIKINTNISNNDADVPTVTIDAIAKDVDRDKTPAQNKNMILTVQHKSSTIFQNPTLWNVILPSIGHVLVFVYLTLAVLHWFKANRKPPLKLNKGLGLLLLIVFLSYWSIFYYRFLKPYCQAHCFQPTDEKQRFLISLIVRWNRRIIYSIPLIIFIYIVGQDCWHNTTKFRPVCGFLLIIFLAYLFSKYPTKIKWRIVLKGITLQITMALCTVRWEAGREFFQGLGSRLEQFLSYSQVGAAFVYSDNLVYRQAVFVFQSLSVLFFVNFLIEILFYFNILQKLFRTLGWFLQKSTGTTAIESVNCCVSVFLGMTEAMLIIKPYLPTLTKSELQAILLGQLSTVAGSVFAAYTSFGINPGYLVTASVMSAPAALSLSKLLYPETEKSRSIVETFKIENREKKRFGSALSAGCEGAISAVHIVMGIVATLIAFISLLAGGNAIISWFADLIGYENVTLVFILGKLFFPVAYLIGVDGAECDLVGQLIATKVVVNEFVAYQRLGEFKKANLLSARSEAIATYALCSFANPGSVGTALAMMSTLCPSQLQNAVELAFRAYIGGVVTCLMTSCIAGLLIPLDGLPGINSHNVFNATANSTFAV